MAPMSTSRDGVTTEISRDLARASGIVGASPAEIFDFLRRPANHAVLSGDGTVRDATSGPEVLELGSRFGMKMKLGVPYRITSKVVEYEPDRLIAWAHIGGHRWRWELGPAGEVGTGVTETFDMSMTRLAPALRLVGYPQRHEGNVAGSVANLIAHFAA